MSVTVSTRKNFERIWSYLEIAERGVKGDRHVGSLAANDVE